MTKTFFVIVLFSLLVVAFAKDRATNYFAADKANGGVRGNQQTVNGFAVWNTTAGNWKHVFPHGITGTINGIIAIGDGLLAFGSFDSVGGKTAAGLAYYDGRVWCAPEGVGLYSYTTNATFNQYENPATDIGEAFAATVSGNDVYLYGSFNQVGNVRGGVAGLVRLTWSAGGVFSIAKVGNGYEQTIQQNPPVQCSFCPRDTQPGKGGKNKLRRYVSGSDTYFVFLAGSPGDLFVYKVNDAAWIRVTSGNGARTLGGAVKDFEVFNNNIYVVGAFWLDAGTDPVDRYHYIAFSDNNGASFKGLFTNEFITAESFGNVPAVLNDFGVPIEPALLGSGFTSIVVRGANSIFVAGGYRVPVRNTTVNNLANELQTRIIEITGQGSQGFNVFSERFAGASYTNDFPQYTGPIIDTMFFDGNDLYAFGGFFHYRQVITDGARFSNRYTEVYKGAIVFKGTSAAAASPAFGGYLTTSITGDTSPATPFIAYGTGNLICFVGTFLSSYQHLTGGLYSYGGDKDDNQDKRWNAVLGNQRFVSAPYDPDFTNTFRTAQPIGANGAVYALHITKGGESLIFGGQFDWIGSQRIGGIGFLNRDTGVIGTVGAGLFQYNNVPLFYSDNVNNNRVGGTVLDIEERGDYLYAAGLFNRNNTGNCLSNVARINFKIGGSGWEAVDGGCDGQINDLFMDGNLLYATGAFSYCGLRSEEFKEGNLFRGRVPTSRIAVVDLSKDPKDQSWRPLGIGLTGGNGVALTKKSGEIYVGGSFAAAGGIISSGGIARWDGKKWKNVVARCQGPCNRAVDVLPFIGTGVAPTADARKPGSCVALRTIASQVYCITNTAVLASWDGSIWRQRGTLTATLAPVRQNSLISVNGTDSDKVIIPSTSGIIANNNYWNSWSRDLENFVPSFGGFSVSATAYATTQN